MNQKIMAAGLACLFTFFGAYAQDIASIRNAAVGSTVTFRGVSLNGAELPNIRYIQDATAGIAIYGSNLSSVQAGDSVLVTGTMTNYNNLAEVTPVTSLTNLGPVSLPAPQVIADPSTIGEQHESELLRFNSCYFDLGGGLFAGNTNYNVAVGGQTIQVRITNGSPLVGTIIPVGEVNLTGIMSQYCFSPETGCTTGYQLLLRTVADIQSTSSIYLTQGLTVSAIQANAFDITWATNVGGTNSYIKYGLTPALELGTIPAGNTTSHTVTVSPLTPGMIYYVKAYSYNAADSAVTLRRPFATQSLSSGTIKAYFNRSVDNSYSTGQDAKFLDHAIADTLAAYINRTQSSLDICIYNWDQSVNGSKIITAVNAAAARGVKVRVLYDASTFNAAISVLNPAILRMDTPQGPDYTIMHNKFVLMDVHSSDPNRPVVWTGSTNFTSNQLIEDANNVIIFQDQSLARGYKMEFDEMWGDTSQTAPGNISVAKFGQFKTDNTPHEYIIGGKRVESYFSPSDQVNSKILNTIATANSDLYFDLFVMTRTDLAYKIKDQIALNSLQGKGILDGAASSQAAYDILSPVMGANLGLNNHPWIMHHKYLIVDQSNTASDPILLTGSHNWSSAADQKNDENTVIVHDASIANQYYQEFMARWCERIGANCLAGLNGQDAAAAPVIFPNPSKGNFSVILEATGNTAVIDLFDITGKCVSTQAYAMNAGKNTVDVNATSLQKGIYLLKLTQQGRSSTQRIVVE